MKDTVNLCRNLFMISDVVIGYHFPLTESQKKRLIEEIFGCEKKTSCLSNLIVTHNCKNVPIKKEINWRFIFIINICIEQ